MNPICNLSQPFPDAGEWFTHKSSFLRLLHIKDNRGSPGFQRYRNHILHLKIIFNPSLQFLQHVRHTLCGETVTLAEAWTSAAVWNLQALPRWSKDPHWSQESFCPEAPIYKNNEMVKTTKIKSSIFWVEQLTGFLPSFSVWIFRQPVIMWSNDLR